MADEKPLTRPDETAEGSDVNTAEAPGPVGGEEEESGEPDIQRAQFSNFKNGTESAATSARKMNMLMDVTLPVIIELGRTQMYIKKILELERGSIIELDKMAGEPVDLYINNKKMAEGEVVVVDKHFGVRITNLIDPEDRIKNLGSQ